MVHRRGFIEEGFLERGSWRGASGEGSPGGGLPLGGEEGRKGGTRLPWAKEGSRTSGVEVGGKKCWAHRCGRKGRRRPHRCAQHLLPPTSTPEGRARHFLQKIANFLPIFRKVPFGSHPPAPPGVGRKITPWGGLGHFPGNRTFPDNHQFPRKSLISRDKLRQT